MNKTAHTAASARRADAWARISFTALAVASGLGWILLADPATADEPPPSILNSVPAFAGLAGAKKNLTDLGFTVQATYIGEVLGNPVGGMRQGTIYDGRVELMLEADMGKLAGIQGGTLHADGYWITGEGLTTNYVGSLMPVSYIEALATMRLYELWYEQKLADNKLALRAGLLGADSDFVSSKYAQLFVNSTTGWPEILAADLPSGGPAYPFSAMGFRAKYDATDHISLLAAIYDGNPAGPGPGNPQIRNAYGVNFRMDDPPLLMQEAQFNYNQEQNASGLPGTVKLGAWEYLGDVADYRLNPQGVQYNQTGLQLFSLPGDSGAYAMIDQLLIRSPEDPAKGVGVFARVFGAPSARNLVDFYFDAGVNVSGFVPGRANDVFGLSFAYTKISASVVNAATAAALPVVPTCEAMVELTYQAQILPGWSAQPVAQYIVNPGAGLGGVSLPNAVVLGLRTTIAF